MDDIEAIKNLKQLLLRIEEADDPNLEPASTPEDETAPPETDSINQPSIDQEIEDVMTEPKIENDQSLDIVIDDMDISDGDAFKNAFKQLKAGISPVNSDEIKSFECKIFLLF